MNRTFSQRYEYESLPEPMKLEELSKELRIELWNSVRRLLLAEKSSHGHLAHFGGASRNFVERVLGRWAVRPEDEIPYRIDEVMVAFKDVLGDAAFNRVLDLIEILVNDPRVEPLFVATVARSFENHAAPYWLGLDEKPFHFFPRSTKEQGEAVRAGIETLHENKMDGAASHLRKASEGMRSGDYGDSIRESIHAVESVARLIDPEAKKTLGPALDSLERAGLLKHTALKDAFKKLYGYTSDEQGIRHSLVDQSSADVDLDEALFMFGACASFAAYLATKSELLGK